MREASGDKVSVKSQLQGSANDFSDTLVGNIRRALSSRFGRDQKVVQVKISRMEEGRVYGFVKVESRKKDENSLLDFEATSNSQGTLLSLEVDVESTKQNSHRKGSDFNSLKEIVACALAGDRAAQETLKRKIAAREITIDELKPEIVKSAIGYALGRLKSVRKQEGL